MSEHDSESTRWATGQAPVLPSASSDAQPSPVQDTLPTDGTHRPDPKRHSPHLGMLLMCLPMVLIVVLLQVQGRASWGSLALAVGCMAMMGFMHLGMSHQGADATSARKPH